MTTYTPMERPPSCICSWAWSHRQGRMVLKYVNQLCSVRKHLKDPDVEIFLSAPTHRGKTGYNRPSLKGAV